MESSHFTKAFLLNLTKRRPDSREDYRDTKNDYLRARVSPTGVVSVSVYKTPPGQRAAKRITLGRVFDDKLLIRSTHPDLRDMPSITQLRAAALKVANWIEQGEQKTSRDIHQQQRRADELTIGRAIKEHIEANTDEWTDNTLALNKARKVGFEQWNDQPLTLVNAKLLRSMVQVLRKQKNNQGRLIGEVGANERIKLLRAAYHTAAINYRGSKDFVIDPWPTADVKHFKVMKTPPRRKTAIKREVLADWWEATGYLDNDLQRDYLRFALLTGMRRREITHKLTADKVNVRSGWITVEDTKNGEDLNIPVSNYALGILRRRMMAADSDGRLFPIEDPKKFIARVATRSKVGFSSHALRNTFISIATATRVPDYYIKLLVNHDSEQAEDVTAGYTSADDVSLRECVNDVAAFVLREVGEPEDAAASKQAKA